MSVRTAAPPPTDAAAGERCRVARIPAELAAHHAVRHHVFVVEQAIFDGSDRDERDADDGTLHAIGLAGGGVCGAVRLYALDDDGLWKGDRLAVLAGHRLRLGAQLVRFAVQSAGERGGTRMVANVQEANLGFFRWLGWSVDGPVAPFRGVPHVPVTIALSRRAL